MTGRIDPVIVLDPGHGGRDSGAVANGIEEKTVNLAVGVGVYSMLKAHGIQAVISRQKDEYVSLDERVELANALMADMFVSIHHNAASNSAATGLEIFHSVVGGEGRRLASLIHRRYQAILPELSDRGVKTRVHADGRDYYHVIRETQMPSIIVEGGFLTNDHDARLIILPEVQERQAQAISQGIIRWYETGKRTLILGDSRVDVRHAQIWATSRKAHPRFLSIAPLYWHYGLHTGIRPEVAYAQAAKETAFGHYGGAVVPNQNNWAGIKTQTASGDLPQDHESFITPDEGVRAHFNHLSAYIGLNPVGEPHGRYHVVKKLPWAGSIRFVEELGNKWAPHPDYGNSIVRDYLTGLLHNMGGSNIVEEKLREDNHFLRKEVETLRSKLDQIKSIVS